LATRSGDTPSASNVVLMRLGFAPVWVPSTRERTGAESEGRGAELEGDPPTVRRICPGYRADGANPKPAPIARGPARAEARARHGARSGREVGLDGLDDGRVVGHDRRPEALDDGAVGAHEELLEVPLDVTGAALVVGGGRELVVERVAGIAVDVD